MRLMLLLLIAVTVAFLLWVGRSRCRVYKPGCCLINVASDLKTALLEVGPRRCCTLGCVTPVGGVVFISMCASLGRGNRCRVLLFLLALLE